jgi:hypothetical protein
VKILPSTERQECSSGGDAFSERLDKKGADQGQTAAAHFLSFTILVYQIMATISGMNQSLRWRKGTELHDGNGRCDHAVLHVIPDLPE